jgi:transmembrane sensor
MGTEGLNPPVGWEAVARYLAGESPAAEREAVQAWLDQHPGESRALATLDDVLDRLALVPDATRGIDVEAALAKVNQQRAASVPKAMARALEFRPRSSRWIPLAAAAALILAFGALLVRGHVATTASPVTIAARTLTTPIGGRDSLRLPDGTTVILGPASRLTLAANYGLSDRRVELRGEAYFDVVHDGSHPFVIDANGTSIRDVGTSFAVHADSIGAVRVSVKSGSVAIARAASSTVLAAGDVATVPVVGDIITERGAASAEDLAWTRGTLVFRDATLSEVRDDLRRWYGIELVTPDTSLLKRHLTATFMANDSITSVLRNIALSLPATIHRRGDTAVLHAPSESSRRK